jgi:hypothetical protein
MTHESPAAPKIYFIDEIAEAIRRTPAATRWLIQSGQLKSTKLAGRRVVTQQQLDEFFAQVSA